MLVIEDDPAQRDAVCDMLESAGFKATGAEHGADALRLLQEGIHPDLIVLDLLMPFMDGWTFRVEQRRHESWARIPVLVLSSERRAQAAAIDAAAFLAKPVDGDRLIEVARAVIAAARSERMEQTEKMASLGLLASSVVHEINNPLAFTLANLNFALEELESWATAKGGMISIPRTRLLDVMAAISESLDGAGRVKNLVADLKNFSRSDEGQHTPVELENAIRCAIKIAAPETKHRAGVIAEVGATPPVRADESKLVQLLVNLIVNAAHAITEKTRTPGHIFVRAGQTPSGGAFIEVEDTGVGIPLALRERIFEPFFTTKPRGVGTGLGLAVCRRIAEQHGGSLTVASELGRGSTFRLELPAMITGPEK